MFTKTYSTLALACGFVAAGLAGQAQADWGTPPADECRVVGIADDRNEPNGANGSWNNDTFWGINFKSGGSGFIQSVTFDLQAGTDSDAVFDLRDNNGYGPVIGHLQGIDASDVTFSPGNTRSSTLTLDFAAGSFGEGDKIRFGADTDFLGNNSASAVGWYGVGFSVTFENGETVSSQFSERAGCLSKAHVTGTNCGTAGIPTPATAGLGLSLLAGLTMRRRHSA